MRLYKALTEASHASFLAFPFCPCGSCFFAFWLYSFAFTARKKGNIYFTRGTWLCVCGFLRRHFHWLLTLKGTDTIKSLPIYLVRQTLLGLCTWHHSLFHSVFTMTWYAINNWSKKQGSRESLYLFCQVMASAQSGRWNEKSLYFLWTLLSYRRKISLPLPLKLPVPVSAEENPVTYCSSKIKSPVLRKTYRISTLLGNPSSKLLQLIKLQSSGKLPQLRTISIVDTSREVGSRPTQTLQLIRLICMDTENWVYKLNPSFRLQKLLPLANVQYPQWLQYPHDCKTRQKI